MICGTQHENNVFYVCDKVFSDSLDWLSLRWKAFTSRKLVSTFFSFGMWTRRVSRLAVTSAATPFFSPLHRKQEADRKRVLCGDSGFPAVWVEWLGCFQSDRRFCFILPAISRSQCSRITAMFWCSNPCYVSRYLLTYWLILCSSFGLFTLPVELYLDCP